MLVLVGVRGGLRLAGFSGILIGPLSFALRVALIRFWEGVYIDKKQLAARKPRPFTAAHRTVTDP